MLAGCMQGLAFLVENGFLHTQQCLALLGLEPPGIVFAGPAQGDLMDGFVRLGFAGRKKVRL